APSYPPNRLFRGNPVGATRPAWARSPTQSARSAMDLLKFRPEESVQVSPVAASKDLRSERRPSLYFCRRTPLPRLISGTGEFLSNGLKIRSLRLVPMTARRS